MMGFGWILVLIVVVLLVSGVLFPNGRKLPTSHQAAPKESSLEVAERRYARGEISRDEFESIKRGLA